MQGFEKKLESQLFLSGQAPGPDDAAVLADFKGAKIVPDQEKYPNVWAWYGLMVLFEDKVVEQWKKEEKGGKGGKKGGKPEKKKDEKKQEKKEEKKEEADDDFDPFAETTEDDKKELEEMKKKAKKEDKKKKEKKGEASLILIEIKGYDPEQDFDALAKKLQEEVKADGLEWKKEYQLKEIAFGMKKIIMGCIVEDAICSIDDIIEKITSEYEDEVQSIDILSFNKL